MILTEFERFLKVLLSIIKLSDLKVIEGIMMSSSIPILIKPVNYNNKYYFDGALFINFPIKMCYEEKKCKGEKY